VLAITWLTALKATAAITWRSLIANVCITLLGIAASLFLGYKIGVLPDGVASLSFQWSRPFASYVALAQIAATVWAVKRSVEVTLLQPPRKLNLYEAVSATWSFAWRHFVAVSAVGTLAYAPMRYLGGDLAASLETSALVLLALWTFGPSFIWAVRGMLRAQARRLDLS
jgi:hypothetical protein